jgi:nicotinate dehydrogenase subunit A
MTAPVAFRLNGQPVALQGESGQSLLDLLRNTLQLKATRFGCGQGQCGACKVMVDGHALSACETPLWAIEGKTVTTVEGLGHRSAPHALQVAFIEEQALQCGFCTSGILMSAAALLARRPQASRQDIVEMLDGHLCRCGAHNRIIHAIEKAFARSTAA